jgi:hypothetical protein
LLAEQNKGLFLDNLKGTTNKTKGSLFDPDSIQFVSSSKIEQSSVKPMYSTTVFLQIWNSKFVAQLFHGFFTFVPQLFPPAPYLRFSSERNGNQVFGCISRTLSPHFCPSSMRIIFGFRLWICFWRNWKNWSEVRTDFFLLI